MLLRSLLAIMPIAHLYGLSQSTRVQSCWTQTLVNYSYLSIF